MTLFTTAHKLEKKLTSLNLIWHLTEEANSIVLEDSINKSNATMMAATSKSKDKNGKGKTKAKAKAYCTNPNCNKDGHMIDQCFEKGGGKEKEVHKWVKKQAARKAASVSAHVADNVKKDKDKNYTMLTYSIPDDSSTLIVTSDFKSEAHATSGANGIILNSGASSHFTPNRLKLMNYTDINPEPIRAADGCTFSALSKGDLKVELPNKNQKLTPITLKNVYYSPHMVFTLMSVSCVDQAGFSVHQKWILCCS